MKIKIENGSKFYNGINVLHDINVEFTQNNIYGILGTNGSGKTQLLKVIAGFITLEEGSVFQNEKLIGQRASYIKNAGILIEHPDFISHFTLLENLSLIKCMCANVNIDIDFWLDYYEIRQFSNKKYKHLSLGTKQKMRIIQAIMHNPDILILDEPMNGLDNISVQKTKHLIKNYKNNSIIILTSHIKGDIEELCTEIYQIEQGGMFIRP